MDIEFFVDKLDKFFPVGILFVVDRMDRVMGGGIVAAVDIEEVENYENMMDKLGIVALRILMDI